MAALEKMNAALIKKTYRDYRLPALGAVALLIGFVMVFMLAVSTMLLQNGRFWAGLPWVRRLMSAMLGADIGEMLTRTGITSLVFTHALTWVVLIGFLLTLTSGVLAGEIDRGTMDLLAALPISRTGIYTSLSLVALLFGLPICWAVWMGVGLGRMLVGWWDVSLDDMAMLACHLYAVYCFLTCFAIAVSALCNRRTTALLLCFAVIFYAFVVNLIVAFWPAVRKIAFTSFLHYYPPLPIVRDHAMRWNDIAVLLTAGLLCWIAGLIGFRRRDVPAR